MWRRASKRTHGHVADRSAWSHRVNRMAVTTGNALNKVGPRRSVSSVLQHVLPESLLSRRMALVTLLVRRKRPMVGVAARKGKGRP